MEAKQIKELREEITSSGVRAKMINLKIYNHVEFMQHFKDSLSDNSLNILDNYVTRLQVYFDDLIIELKNT